MNVKTLKNKALAVLAVLLCALLATAMFGCSGGSSSSKTKLIVGFDQAYPPYGFVGDDGEYTGFDIDLAREVCKDQGWDLELQAIDWDSKDAMLQQGQINCIWNGFTMEGREGLYAFSDPYMKNMQVVVVKKGANITTLDGLKDKAVITQTDSAALEVLEGDRSDVKGTFSRLDTISDYNNAFMQLDSGAVDAVACDMSIALYQIKANPDKYEGVNEPLSVENYAVGFKNSDEGRDMASKVTESMKKLNESGKVKELCEKYESYGMSYDNWELQ